MLRLKFITYQVNKMGNRSEHAHMVSQCDTLTLDAGAGNCDHFTGGVEEGLTSTS